MKISVGHPWGVELGGDTAGRAETPMVHKWEDWTRLDADPGSP